MFENRVLREICGFKRDVVKGDWIKTHNEELNDMYLQQILLGLGNRVG